MIVAAAAVAAQAASTAASAVVDVATLRARVTADDRRHPIASIALARQALSTGSLAAADRRWLTTVLVKDLVRMRRDDEAAAIACEARKAAQTDRDRVHFGVSCQIALVDAARFADAIATYRDIAPLLPSLVQQAQDKDARLDVANAWRLAGVSMTGLGRLPEGNDLLTRALRLYDERSDAAYETSETLSAMALVHFKSGNAEAALRTQQRAIDVSEAAGERSTLSSYYLRKAHFLSSLGRVDEQFRALEMARKQAQDELRDYNLAVIATNLADVALQKKDFAAALRYADEAMPLVERTGDHESLWICWINKGIALNRLRRPGGIEWIRKAIAAFEGTPGKQDIAAGVYGMLAEELAFNGDFEHAYETEIRFKRLTDAVRQAADQKRITEANAAYESEKRQRQIASLEQEQRSQQRFRLVLALAAILGLATAVVAGISRFHVQRAYRAMRDMALRDPLTGLRNRRYLEDKIEEDMAQARRLHAGAMRGEAPVNADVAFMMIDVDHFKSVNDVHGHAAGDEVLRQCAEVLRQQVRASDTLVRWGGEEFLVLARQTSAHTAHHLARRIQASFAAHPFVLSDGLVLRKTCSIGFACYPFSADMSREPAADWQEIVALADQCLYVAKASGRDLWVGAVARDTAGTARQAGPLDLRAGVESGALVLTCSEGRNMTWPEPKKRP